DLTTAYTARVQGQAPTWQPLPIQYADYTLWQHEGMGQEQDPESAISHQLGYWTTALANLPEQIQLPTDRPRPATGSRHASSITFTIPAVTHRQLAAVAREGHASLFMALQAALATLLTRLGAGNDIPIGSPIAGRTDDALEGLVGFFVNTLVLRTDTSGRPSFRELLHRVRTTDLDAYSHQDVPFERLVEHLNPTRSLAHHPLFQVMLTLNNNDQTATLNAVAQLPDLAVDSVAHNWSNPKFDLSFSFSETREEAGGVSGVLDFSSDLFHHETAQTIVDRLIRLLTAVTAHPDLPITDIDVLTHAEERQVLEEWNGQPGDSMPPVDVVALFERQAAATPDAVALTCEGESLTYAGLNARANRLARWLAERGVGPEVFVAVDMPRGLDAVTALLGTLKSGAAYVPLDPEYPAERTAHILADAAPALHLTGLDGLSLDGCEDTDPPRAVRADNAAYMLYTSGSTGRPKGAVIEHRALACYLAHTRSAYPAAAESTLLHSPLAFDLTGTALWTPLTTGGTIHLTDLTEHAPQPAFLKATPSHLPMLTALPESVSPTSTLILGGEAL
ncbi:condensation domain-containing protein, partial [Streptomyces sp. AC550_RSS872]|uniref:non-ribosomal peptide synthetase n=1 Tax=Streptomyces sp. AC550_RSS872 TaxID=2823689 RepID=UPI001C25BC5A